METMHAAGRRTLPPVPRPTAERATAATEESPTERFVVDLTTDEQRAVAAGDLPDDVDPLPGDVGEQPEDGDRLPDGDAATGATAEDDDESSDDPAAADDTASDDDAASNDAAASDDTAAAQDDDRLADEVEEASAPAISDDADVPDDTTATQTPIPEPGDLDPAQEFVTRLRMAAADFAEAAGAESAVVREAVPPARHRRARCRLVLRYADASEVDVTFLGPAGRPGTPSRHGFDRQIRRWLAAGQRREDAWLVTDPDAEDGLAVDLSAWIAAA